MSEDERGRAERTLRSFGSRLGGIAKRVTEIVSEVSNQITIPEELRELLATAQTEAFAGDLPAAQTRLQDALHTRPDQPLLRAAYGLLRAHCYVAGEEPAPALEGPAATKAIGHLEATLQKLAAGDPDRALDESRRALRADRQLPARLQRELQFLAHCTAARARTAQGQDERAIREWQKARARMPEGLAGPVFRAATSATVHLLLLENRALEALDLIGPIAAPETAPPWAVAWLARIYAAAGDRPAAADALTRLESSDDIALRREAKLRCTLTLPELAGDLSFLADSLRELVESGESTLSEIELGRLSALAQLSALPPTQEYDPPAKEQAKSILDALFAASDAAPRPRRDRHLVELIHAAWRLGECPTLGPRLDKRLALEGSAAPDAVRICAAYLRELASDDADFEPGPPPRFRAGVDTPADAGPSPESPLRQPALARAVHGAAQSLVTAKYAAAAGAGAEATDLVVMALVDAPGLPDARAGLAKLVPNLAPTRLEDLLQDATSLLVGVPSNVLGVSLEGAADALARVVAARERLARPLTIAIMGEFSSGKSTFVNALLREEVAPMGLLPTTSTINVFRRGTRDVARIHDRDGHVTTMGGGEISGYLRGLDAESASRIHHVEIERPGAHLGDAAVVDTPGLNALDAYHERVAREFLDEADAVVWIFSATRGGAASEGAMLAQLRAGGRQVLGILNKADTLSPQEQEELRAYLREQLGEVLVDVLPVCATEALAHRAEKDSTGADPFAPVEAALENLFLSRARELKHTVTLRRVQEALTEAGHCVDKAVATLDERSATFSEPDRELGQDALEAFAIRLESAGSELADRLTREAAGLGVVRFSEGLLDEQLEEEDLLYLAQAVQEAAHILVSREVREVRTLVQGDRVARVLRERFIPWALGFTSGRFDAETLNYWLLEAGPLARDGEAALRGGLASLVAPSTAVLARRARSLAPELARIFAQEIARVSSAPKAQALRLQVTVRSGLDALLRAASSLET